MSKKNIGRNAKVDQIQELTKEFSTLTVVMHQSIAHAAGLAATDHKYIDLLLKHGSMTAGRLSELSGLSTGSVTGMIDRLERENLVKRERDPVDRRKVVVILNREVAFQRIGPAFKDMMADVEKLYDGFTVSELDTVQKYLEAVIAFTQKQIAGLNKKRSSRLS
ncbi:MarR family winged helix-turn-helix transcriptional regulator [Chitinophaga sp.]|uniref:MarR family winged helix-turn-helix transcriptional regulator n=1 Tax=Chitinophaga sp. TaxID=1869181 RepID=UPI002C66AF30|nr:MarR family transcriptional regulator [Chitinophaga sp.]HWV69505.1 MarR family transcriptional regulator [Chitinophaga sp.]